MYGHESRKKKREFPASFGLLNQICLIKFSPYEELVQTWNVTPDRSILALDSKGCRDHFMMIHECCVESPRELKL